MAVRKSRAQLGEVVRLRAKSMLPCRFYRKLGEMRHRIARCRGSGGRRNSLRSQARTKESALVWHDEDHHCPMGSGKISDMPARLHRAGKRLFRRRGRSGRARLFRIGAAHRRRGGKVGCDDVVDVGEVA